MTAWTEGLLTDLDEADERARMLAEGVTEEQLNWQPGPGLWSVGQCLDHLRVMNEVYLPPIAQALEGKPTGMASEIRPGWFGRYFLENFVEPSEKSRQVKAPKKIVPAAKVEEAVLERLLAGNKKLRTIIDRASEHDVNRIRFKNPFIPLIRFTVGTGLTIVVRHEHRHLLHAERVRGDERFPKSNGR